MKVGISEWALHQHFGRGVQNPRPLSVSQFIDLAGAWKLDGLQIESVPRLSDGAALEAIRGQAERLGLYLEMEAGGFNPEGLTQKLEVAKVLGIKVVRTFPALKRYRKDPPLSEQLRQAERNLRQIAPVAEKLDIRLAVENHMMALADQDISGFELAELLDTVDSPFIGVCLDTGNCLGFMDDPLETAGVLAPRTFSVHLKDYQIKRSWEGAQITGCPLGQGCVDLPAIVRLLRSASPLKDELCLNIEAPVERLDIPFLTSEFWEAYPEAHARRLPGFLRFIGQRGQPSDAEFRIPAELGRPLEDVLAHEQEFCTQSIAYVRKLLGEL